MGEPNLTVRNVRPLGGKSTDMFISGGRFVEAAVPGAPEIDGRDLLALPGLVEAHTHMDKNLLGMDWYRNSVGPRITDRIAADRAAKRDLNIDPARQSARQVEATLPLGTTFIRSHVDVDTEIGIKNVLGVLESRARLSHLAEIEIVAFPQSGLLSRPGTKDLMRAALAAGADIVGGIDPSSLERDPKGHLDAVFGLAEAYGKPVDIHLHEPGELGAFSLELIAERSRALGMAGRVVVSHASCLGMVDEARLGQLIAALSEAGIAIMTVASAGSPVPPVRRLRAEGVPVCSGSDGFRGTWDPFGNGDMLARAAQLAQRLRLTNDADLEDMLDICSTSGAAALGHHDRGLKTGDRGDLVLVQASCVAEAVATIPPRRLVISSGWVVHDALAKVRSDSLMTEVFPRLPRQTGGHG